MWDLLECVYVYYICSVKNNFMKIQAEILDLEFSKNLFDQIIER